MILGNAVLGRGIFSEYPVIYARASKELRHFAERDWRRDVFYIPSFSPAMTYLRPFVR
jgi:hypothetical protein